MTFTTESLLESTSAGFGIETLSPLQRAKARLYDGRPLDELADRADVRAMVGCDPRFLPTGVITEIFDIAGIRTLKTIGSAAATIRMTQSVDLSPIRTGETPRVYWLSTTMEQARPGLDVLIGTIMSRRALRGLVIGEPTADSITLRHPTGRAVEIKIVPASRAGATLVGRWCAGCVFDEAPRWSTSDEGSVVSLEDCRTAIRGRLLPGAQIFYIGSPWAPEGLVWKMHEEHFGKPTDHVLVMRADARALNPRWFTPARCAEIKAANPRTYMMDVEAQFGAAATGAYELDAVTAAGVPRAGQYYRGARVLTLDPTKLMGSDRYGVAVLGWDTPTETRLPVWKKPPPHTGLIAETFIGYETDERGDTKYIDVDPRPVLRVDFAEAWDGRGMRLEDIERRLTDLVGTYRPQLAVMDYGGDTQSLLSLFMKLGIRAEAFPWSEQQRRAGFEWIGRILADRRAEIAQEAARRDLLRVNALLSPNGKITYRARRTAEGHADLASCLVSYAIAENEGLLFDSPIRPNNQVHISPGR